MDASSQPQLSLFPRPPMGRRKWFNADICFDCGEPAAFEHHVRPKSRGGSRTVPLCAACHEQVHGLRAGKWVSTKRLTKAGLNRLKAQGVRLGGVALGWKRSDAVDAGGRRIWVQDPEELATVERIRSLRAAGASLRLICETLDAEGRPTKRGGRWAPQTVSQVLRRMGLS